MCVTKCFLIINGRYRNNVYCYMFIYMYAVDPLHLSPLRISDTYHYYIRYYLDIPVDNGRSYMHMMILTCVIICVYLYLVDKIVLQQDLL